MSQLIDVLIGFGAFMIYTAIQKAVIEPVAYNMGRKVIETYLEDACQILDSTLEIAGLDFDPEGLIRSFLDMEASDLTQNQVDEIVEQVFLEWDLRMVACDNKNAHE